MELFKGRASKCGELIGTPKKVKGEVIQPLLTKTAESYVEQWVKEQLYGRKKEFSNKYTSKGLIMEDDGIDLIAEYLMMKGLIKNEESAENDWLKGTCDVNVNGQSLIIDNKSSWDAFTFPLFKNTIPTKLYYWQGQAYMDLYGKDNYSLIYTLVDTPQHLIEKEAFYYAKDNGMVYEDVLMEFTEKMTYNNIPLDLRVKEFKFKRDNDDIELLHKQVEVAREHIKRLLDVEFEMYL